MCKTDNYLSSEQRSYTSELNQISHNAREIPRWPLVDCDGRAAWLIPSDLDSEILAERLFHGLPEDYLADLWLDAADSISPKYLPSKTQPLHRASS